MAFVETPVFPEDISYGSSGGPVYRTEIVELLSGYEQRNASWVYPKHRYDVRYGIKDQADLYAVLQFFHIMGGAYTGFRYKDWLDYASSADGTVTAIDQALGTGDGNTRTFQLKKTYTLGGYSRIRLIKKPVSGSVKIGIDGNQSNSGWSVSTSTGIVTFTNAPALGKVLTAGYFFHVPVRFSEDTLAVDLADVDVASSQIVLQEIRV